MDFKVVEAWLIIFFVKIPGWFLKHPRVLIPIALVIVGVVGYRSCNQAPAQKPGVSQTLSVQQQKAPPVADAPTVLQTLSRVYYVVKYTQPTPTKVILYRWYEWSRNKWVLQNSKEGVPFDKAVTGDFRIFQR